MSLLQTLLNQPIPQREIVGKPTQEEQPTDQSQLSPEDLEKQKRLKKILESLRGTPPAYTTGSF